MMLQCSCLIWLCPRGHTYLCPPGANPQTLFVANMGIPLLSLYWCVGVRPIRD